MPKAYVPPDKRRLITSYLECVDAGRYRSAIDGSSMSRVNYATRATRTRRPQCTTWLLNSFVHTTYSTPPFTMTNDSIKCESGLSRTLANQSKLWESGKYSDLTITCHGREWRVHRNIVCLHSRFFAAACDGRFKVTFTSVPLAAGHRVSDSS